MATSEKTMRPVHIRRLLFVYLSCAGLANANCEPSALQSSKRIVSLAQKATSMPEKVLLLEQVLDHCRLYDWQMEMGNMFYREQQWQSSIDAFQLAIQRSSDSAMQLSQAELRLRAATANQRLAAALLRSGQSAQAAATLELSRSAYASTNTALDQDFLNLQGELDDSLTNSDAATLTDTLAIQRTRNIRGIGVRSRTQTNPVTDSVSATISSAISTPGNTVAQDEPIPDGARLNIQVLFETGSDQLAASELVRVARIATAIDGLSLGAESTVYVIGHTDQRGTEKNNQLLSERRAKTVVGYLSGLITTEASLIAVGNGESDLRYPGNNADSYRRNRRVEILIVEN